MPGAGIVKPNRSVGDILISLEYAGGGSNPSVTVYGIASVTDHPNGQVVTFTAANAADTQAATRSATNWVPLTNVSFPSGNPYTVPAFNFAEASVNLTALGVAADCLSFQQGSIRSRTGGAPDASQLKDASAMFPLDLNTCGRLTVEKRDAITNDLVAGATFKFEPDPTVGSNKTSLTVTDGSANDPDGKADGKIVFAACEPATYKVTELTPPPGYFLPADLSTTKTIEVGGSATFTFEDPLAEIRWQKEDAAGQLLGGAEFSITPNPRTGSGSLTVVDNGANDADDTAGEFAVRRVLIGGPYVIAETQPPAGYIGTSATYSVTIAADLASPFRITVPAGTFVNTLGSIRWVKNGPDGTALLGGAFFTVTPDPRDGVGTLVIADNDVSDADPTAGEFRVNNARTGTYSVQETAAPVGYILDSSPASVTVSAATQHPQIAVGTFVNHLGKIRWLKYGPDGQTLLGGAVFSVSPTPATGSGSLSVGDCVTLPCNGADKDETPGEFELQNLPVRTYSIVETLAPAGYVLDASVLTAEITSPMASPYTANAGSVTNRLGTISWVKNGPNGTELLGGAIFTITPNPRTGDGQLIVGDDGDNDADKTPGEFQVTGVRVNVAGGYSIAETTPPAGYVGDTSVATVNPTTASPDVSVAAGTWVNTLGSLAWEKRDGSGALLGGATFLLAGPNGLSLSILDNDANDADKDNGQFKVNGLKLGDYTVTETIAPAGYVMDTTPRSATLTAAAADVEITTDFVNTLGSLSWVKQDAKGSLLAGATFRVTGPFGYDVTVLDDSALGCRQDLRPVQAPGPQARHLHGCRDGAPGRLHPGSCVSERDADPGHPQRHHRQSLRQHAGRAALDQGQGRHRQDAAGRRHVRRHAQPVHREWLAERRGQRRQRPGQGRRHVPADQRPRRDLHGRRDGGTRGLHEVHGDLHDHRERGAPDGHARVLVQQPAHPAPDQHRQDRRHQPGRPGCGRRHPRGGGASEQRHLQVRRLEPR